MERWGFSRRIGGSHEAFAVHPWSFRGHPLRRNPWTCSKCLPKRETGTGRTASGRAAALRLATGLERPLLGSLLRLNTKRLGLGYRRGRSPHEITIKNSKEQTGRSHRRDYELRRGMAFAAAKSIQAIKMPSAR